MTGDKDIRDWPQWKQALLAFAFIAVMYVVGLLLMLQSATGPWQWWF